MLLQATIGGLHVANGDPEEQFTALRFGEQPGMGALANPPEFDFAQRPFEAE